MDKDELVEVDYDILEHETDLAWLVTIDDEEVWLPKSQCVLWEDKSRIDVPEWLAEEKGLI